MSRLEQTILKNLIYNEVYTRKVLPFIRSDYFSDDALQEQGLYYGKNRIDTLDKYNNLFVNHQAKLRGEGSVSYFFYDDVPNKIKKYNPDSKIIIMLLHSV